MNRLAPLPLGIAIFPLTAQADWHNDLSMNLGLTGAAGADTVAKAYFSNIDQTSTVRAGGFYYARIGLDSGNEDWGVLLNSAYHFDGTTSQEKDKNRWVFSRVAFDLLPYIRVGEMFRVGLGVTYHLNPTVTLKYSDVTQRNHFDDAWGATVFGGVQLPDSKTWLELRYTQISYDGSDLGTSDLDGQHFGLILHWVPDF